MRLEVTRRWAKAFKKPFISYPYWFLKLKDNKGNVAEAPISKEEFMKAITEIVKHEKMLDVIMERNPEFPKWSKAFKNVFETVSLETYQIDKLEKLKQAMMEEQKNGEKYDEEQDIL